MGRLIDLTGKQFGRLSVVARAAENTKRGTPRWRCVCECGEERTVSGSIAEIAVAAGVRLPNLRTGGGMVHLLCQNTGFGHK
jgi:hypothetical protein